jgi:hypothetical protein
VGDRGDYEDIFGTVSISDVVGVRVLLRLIYECDRSERNCGMTNMDLAGESICQVVRNKL